MIGEKAPDFIADTTNGKINFHQDYIGKWVILFSHPADFTPVCTTEFMTFAKMYEEFRELNTELIGLSIDGVYSHIAWLRTIKEKIEYKGMKNIDVKFPVIADLKMEVAKKYGMIAPNIDDTKAVRSVFIIDPEVVIRAEIHYPMSVGRNFQEIKRVLIALQTSDNYNVAIPADWQPGDDVIIPPPISKDLAQQRVDSPEEGTKVEDWFMSFKKLT